MRDDAHDHLERHEADDQRKRNREVATVSIRPDTVAVVVVVAVPVVVAVCVVVTRPVVMAVIVTVVMLVRVIGIVGHSAKYTAETA